MKRQDLREEHSAPGVLSAAHSSVTVAVKGYRSFTVLSWRPANDPTNLSEELK